METKPNNRKETEMNLNQFLFESAKIETMMNEQIKRKENRFFIFYCSNCSESTKTNEQDLELCPNCSESIGLVFDSSEIESDCIRCFYSESCNIRKQYSFDLTDCEIFKTN